MQTNAYGAGVQPRYTGGTIDPETGKAVRKTGGDLTMQDFLNLLAAQMANQDSMNPSSDTEFIGQMAQFTSLQTMQTLTEVTYAQYSSSMVGKKVLISNIDSRGAYEEIVGMVTHVRFLGGVCYLTVNGEEYNMNAVMEVMDKDVDPIKPPSEDGKEDETEKPDEKPKPDPEPPVDPPTEGGDGK